MIICSASLCYHRSLSGCELRFQNVEPEPEPEPSNYGGCEIRPEKLIIRHHSLRTVITKSLFGKTKEFLYLTSSDHKDFYQNIKLGEVAFPQSGFRDLP